MREPEDDLVWIVPGLGVLLVVLAILIGAFG